MLGLVRIASASGEKETHSAEKGYLRETGNLLFHLSLILILVGVSFGALFGMRGEAIINVGERFINVPTTYDSLALGKLTTEKSLSPFEIKLDRFVAEYDPRTNQALDYKAWVTITEDGKSEKKVLKVNKPLTFGNSRVYLQANGYSPVVTVRDSQGNVALQGQCHSCHKMETCAPLVQSKFLMRILQLDLSETSCQQTNALKDKALSQSFLNS